MKKRININELRHQAYNVIRASQINGGAFYIDMYTKDALKNGETNQFRKILKDIDIPIFINARTDDSVSIQFR